MPLLPSLGDRDVIRRSGNQETLVRADTGLLRRSASRLIGGGGGGIKSVPGQNAGFGGIGVGSLTRRITSFIQTYGGDTPITWIYACVKLISEEMSQYPYAFVDPTTAPDLAKCVPIPYEKAPEDLKMLLRQPNEFMTYSQMNAWMAMDVELVGNSYWLKDQQNGLGQPLFLQRMRPEFVRIATDRQGKVLGYTYTVQGVQVPLNLDEVIHYRTPNPHSEYYGMGTVQGVLQDAGIQIGIDEHVIGFFAHGAKISGVLTIAGTLPPEQFERVRQQFREEYAGGGNEFSILIAEQGTKFEPVTSNMNDAGVKDLKDVSKDAILSGFGVHQEMLGGSRNSGDARMDDAWKIFSRKMAPKARFISETQTSKLVQLWGEIGLWLIGTEIDSRETKIARARDMLGAGATVTEARVEQGLAPVSKKTFPHLSDEEIRMANLPILPSGYDPFFVVQQAPGVTPGGDGDGGGEPFGDVLPGGSNGNTSGDVQPATPAGEGDRARAIESVTGKKVLLLPSGKAVPAPSGFEDVGDLELNEAEVSDAEALVAIQVRIYEDEVPPWELEMVGFFNEQRNRVLREVSKFVTDRDAKRLGKRSKKDLDIDRVFHPLQENQLARDLYHDRATRVAERTVGEIAELFDSAKADVRGIVDRLSSRLDTVNETTRSRIKNQLDLGRQRSYSTSQIANGVPAENYLGIAGVFDSAVETRAPLIAKTELAVVYNISSLGAYHQIGVGRVEVVDGENDKACRDARGQVWSLEQAVLAPIAHPGCLRSFAPIFAGTGRPDSV